MALKETAYIWDKPQLDKFLLEKAARPLQDKLHDILWDKNIKLSKNPKSVVRSDDRSDVLGYYFTDKFRIYTDRLAEFVCQLNTVTNGDVVGRLARIYSEILIADSRKEGIFKCEHFLSVINSLQASGVKVVLYRELEEQQ